MHMEKGKADRMIGIRIPKSVSKGTAAATVPQQEAA